MSTPAVSIIVPAFNIAPYIEGAIKSVMGQTFRDWELILVDDGSSDGTGEVCDGAAAKDERIRVIHRSNGGSSEARNTGLDAARGEWIYFLDGDDLLHPDALMELTGAAERSGARLAVAPYVSFADGKRPPRVVSRGPCGKAPEMRVLSSTNVMEMALYQQGADSSVWGKLFGRELWVEERFTRGIIFEDLDAFYRVWPLAERVAVLDTPLYFYRVRKGSQIHEFTPGRFAVLDVTDRILERALAERPELEAAARDRRMSAHFNVLLLMYRHGAVDAAQEARCLRVVGEEAGRSLRNGRVRIKNRLGALCVLLAGSRRGARLMSKFIL